MTRFPAQMSPYSRFKHYERKGLHNIIITANGKAFYLVCIFNPSSQKKDWAGYVIPNTLTDLQAICPGHIDVKQNNIRLLFCLFKGFCAIRSGQNTKALALKKTAEHRNDVAFIVGNQDSV